MATYTPPPYFPQGSLTPPDKKRYLKFKLGIVAAGVLVLSLIAAAGFGVWYLAKWLF